MTKTGRELGMQIAQPILQETISVRDVSSEIKDQSSQTSRNIQNLVRKYKQKREVDYDLVEVMACPGGEIPPHLTKPTVPSPQAAPTEAARFA